jgi:serine/threonine-protein kinase
MSVFALDWVGRLVGDRYRLMEVVGRGGHCAVYRAVGRFSETEVAVKMLLDGVPHREELEERLSREHGALLALRGTSALQPIDIFRTPPTGTEEGNVLCLVTELLRGQDLDDYLKDMAAQGLRIEVPTVLEMIAPLVDTLEVAHARGITHRDLKPPNVFVLGRGGPGGVRLLDFGLAWSDSTSRITRDGFVLGSPSYMAPEVWAGNPRALDSRVDVYSLGAVIFRMFAGRVPFPTDSMREKLQAVTTSPRPSLHAIRPDLPREMDIWVERALAIDRSDRFPDVRSLWNALVAVFDR